MASFVQSADAKFRAMTGKLMNATVRISIEDNYPFTGSIVGSRSGQTVIFTAAHCLKVSGLSIEEVQQKLVVKFYGDNEKYGVTICCCLLDSEIALLQVNKETPSCYVLDFAPNNEWELTHLQPIMAFGHPEGTTYRSGTDEICSPEYQNPFKFYDKKMILFDHRLDLVGGCSGAAIINEHGHIVGLQTGVYSKNVDVMGAGPLDRLLKSKEQALKKVFETRKSTTKNASMADEMQSMNAAMERVTAKFSDASFRRSDIIPVDLQKTTMKIAVHIKYINSTLRNEVFDKNFVRPLQELIEQKFLSGAGSSSSGGDGGGRRGRGGARK